MPPQVPPPTEQLVHHPPTSPPHIDNTVFIYVPQTMLQHLCSPECRISQNYPGAVQWSISVPKRPKILFRRVISLHPTLYKYTGKKR